MVTQYEFADLPLSGVLEVAMLDLKKVRRSKKYVVDFDEWHQPNPELGVCHVCLAGAVIAKTFKTPAKHHVGPFHFFSGACERLFALNEVRGGLIQEAILRLNKKAGWLRISQAMQDLPPDITMGLDPDKLGYPAFFRKLSSVAKVLRRHGF